MVLTDSDSPGWDIWWVSCEAAAVRGERGSGSKRGSERGQERPRNLPA